MTQATAAGPPAAATRLSLEGDLTIYRAVELRNALVEALGRASAIDVDLSKVTEVDSAGVQLLMLVAQTAQARGIDLRFVELSPAVVEVIELLQLRWLLGVPAGTGVGVSR